MKLNTQVEKSCCTWSFPLATIMGKMHGLARVIVKDDMMTGWKSRILQTIGDQ
jgi:hypothetical protein